MMLTPFDLIGILLVGLVFSFVAAVIVKGIFVIVKKRKGGVCDK